MRQGHTSEPSGLVAFYQIVRRCLDHDRVEHALTRSLDQYLLARPQVVQACVAERVERGVELFLVLDPA